VPVGGWPGTETPARPLLVAPPSAREVLAQLCAGGSMRADHISGAFELLVYDPADTVEVGQLRVRFRPVPHFIPTNAVEIVDGATRMTFSADCAPNEALCEFARDTDLLLIEATLPRPERDGQRGHLTPAEAGEHGARARARLLVLTHFSDELDAEWARGEAERAFGRAVEVAHEGAVYTLDG
jgi:ribonuclease BN (tRNA processing enzyme)